jgi:NAD(P)-dependent dehydrogenase (short-subunit alcohol dehydrogenase family)
MNQTIVITGAGGVLCSTLAKELAKSGAPIALLDLNLKAAEAIAAEINSAGGKAKAYAANVLDRANLEQVHEEIVKDFGECRILINGAGGNHPSATTKDEVLTPGSDPNEINFFNLKQEGFSHVLDLNIWGTVLPCQIFAKDMVGAEGCSILNISSMAAYSPLTKTPAYCAAKAGISNFTQWLAVHLAPQGIRVNALAPGFFLTQQNSHLLVGENGEPTPRAGKILRNTPMGRFGKPEELLGALQFLLDDTRASFVTGCILPVDGGFSSYSGV